jgi:hypothetical protein
MSKKTIIGWVLCVVVSIAVLSCTGCAVCRYYGRTNGVLLDSRSDRPIPGAAVVGVYRIEHGTVGGMVEESVDAVETSTDSLGTFALTGKLVCAPRLPFSGFSKQPAIYILAPGYETVELLREQTYSHVDQTNVWLSATTYRTVARPIVSVVTTQQTQVYEFRISPADTDVNTHFVNGPASKFPNYLRLFNTERAKRGLPEWKGWRQ